MYTEAQALALKSKLILATARLDTVKLVLGTLIGTEHLVNADLSDVAQILDSAVAEGLDAISLIQIAKEKYT